MSQPALTRVVQHLRQAVGSSDTVTDAQLLERFLTSRDEVAFELLVRRHERLVLGVCRRVLRNPHDADDAFQATFLLLVRKAGSIGKREALAAWLHQVAYRVAVRANTDARRRTTRETTAVDPTALPSREPDPAEAALHDLGPVLDRELSRLPEKYRAAIALCYLEGCTYEEAAQRLGCPRGTVSIWLTRARELLRTRLARRGVVLSAAALAVLAGSAKAAPVAVTVRAALSWAVRSTTAVVSSRAAALVEGVLRTMMLTKIKFVAAVLTAVALVAGGGFLAVQSSASGEEGQPVQVPSGKGSPEGGIGQPPPVTGDPDGGRAPAGQPTPAWQEILQIKAHSDAVLSVVLSPDAKLIASSGPDGIVKLWDLATGKEVRSLAGDGTAVMSVAFSPDGKLLAAAGEGKFNSGKLRLWDVTTGKQLAQTDAGDAPLTSAAFSPDHKLLVVGSRDKTVKALPRDSYDGKAVWSVDLGTPVAAVAVSPDASKVAAVGASADDITDKRFQVGQIQVYDAATGKLLFGTKDKDGPVVAAAFSPDGKLLVSASGDRTVRLWDARTGKEVRKLAGHTNAVTSVAFSPDGKLLATAGADNTVRVWDAATGETIDALKLDKPVAVVVFSPDGRWLVTASGGVVRIFGAKGKAVGGGEVKPPAGGGAAGKDRLDALLQDLLQQQRGDEQTLEALCLACLGRLPTDVEKKFGLGHVGKAKDRREAFADLLHQMTSTKEFAEHVQTLNERARQKPPR